MDRPYVSLSNLETFWTAAKQYIDNMSGGSSPELLQTVQDLVTNLNNEITTREEADIEINRLINAINEYTINGNKVSLSPTLNGDDITLGVSVGDDTNYPTTKTVTSSIQTLRETIAGLGHVMELKGVLDELPTNTTNYENGDVVIVCNKEYVCYNSLWYLLGDATELSQDVSTIKSSYVKSITCEGTNGVTVTPTTASNGDVTITVDALTLNQKFENYLPLTGGRLEGPASTLFVLNNSNSVNNESGIRFELSNKSVGWVGYTSGHGTYLYTYESPHSIGIKEDGTGFIDSNVIMHSGNCSNYALPLSGGAMTDGARIYPATNKLYIGRADNAGYVWMSDMCSQNGPSYWSIHTKGEAVFASTITASNFITTSDRRAKKNITELGDCSKSLELNFYEFDYKDSDNHSAGHVAQEVNEVYPEFVHGEETEDSKLSIDYTGLHSVQIKALKNKIDRLETENDELRERIDKLEKLIEKLM